MKPVSAVVITCNEERSLRGCLESLAFADEIVVVDSMSTDRTVSIAKEYTGKVFSIEWKGYAFSKNYGIDQASSDWILSLDADERISDTLRDSIQNLESDGYSGYRIPRRTWYLGRWISGGGWYPDMSIRLFDRNHGRFRDVPVHESVELDGKAGCLTGDILHYSYRDITDHVQRINRYSGLVSDTWVKKGRHAAPLFMVTRTAWEFFRFYILRKGFRDGKAGVVLAGMHAFYTFLKYAKTIEHHIDTNHE